MRIRRTLELALLKCGATGVQHRLQSRRTEPPTCRAIRRKRLRPTPSFRTAILSGPALGGPDFVLSPNPIAPGLWPEKTKTRLLAQIATEHRHINGAQSACQSRRTRKYVLTDILSLEQFGDQSGWEMLAKEIVCAGARSNRKKLAVSNHLTHLCKNLPLRLALVFDRRLENLLDMRANLEDTASRQTPDRWARPLRRASRNSMRLTAVHRSSETSIWPNNNRAFQSDVRSCLYSHVSVALRQHMPSRSFGLGRTRRFLKSGRTTQRSPQVKIASRATSG